MSEHVSNERVEKAYRANLERVESIAHDAGYVMNSDGERVKKVVGLMTRNYLEFGKYYCPCKQSHPLNPEQDVLCPCPTLREEMVKDGHCYCRLLYAR